MGYTYTSIIDDGELIQGDTSDITLLFTDMTQDLSGWTAKHTIRESFDTPIIIERNLPVNTEEIESIPAGGCFIHQIQANESNLLQANKKYVVSIQIESPDSTYVSEVAQFKLKIKPQGVI